jgi:hypothetical protein
MARIITPTSEGKPPKPEPIPSRGPETGGDIDVSWFEDIFGLTTPGHALQAPLSMATKVLDIGGVGLGEEFDQTPPKTAYEPGLQRVPSQGVRNDLAWLRMVFPFVPIMPFPDDVVSVVLTTASVAYDMNLPDGTVIVNFDADGPDWWISNYGRAAIPNVNSTPTSGGDWINAYNGSAMVHPPNTQYFYTGSMRQISLVSATAGRIVQARCWIPPGRPR